MERFLFVNKENTRYFRQVREFAVPFFQRTGSYILIFASYIRCYTQFGLRTASLHYILHHFIVSIWSFYKQLSLVFRIDSILKLFQPFKSVR